MRTLQNEPVAVAQISEAIETKKKSNKTSFSQSFLTKHPGHLTSKGILQVKTRSAQRHFLQLLKFAKEVKVIYRAAKQDDPYADARLIEIEAALEKVQQIIQAKMHFYQPLIPTTSSLSLSLVDTQTPLELPLQFTTPYAHMAARVLVEFDTLIRCIISLYQWGLLAEMPRSQLLQQLDKPLFQLWKTTKNFQLTGVTRAVLMEPTALVNQETTSFKPLDPQILTKKRRAKYAPRIFVAAPKNSSTGT